MTKKLFWQKGPERNSMNQTIPVVHDEGEIADLLRVYLEKDGCHVITYGNSEEVPGKLKLHYID